MGRFYKTSKPEYLDFIYKQPKNLLLQAVQKASEGVDKNLASVADLYGRLKSEALNPDVKRRDEIIDAYKSKIDNLSNKIYENPMDYRGYTPNITTLSDDIKDNLERGELAAFESNVKARQTYSDKLDAQVKAKSISQAQADWLLNKYDADFKNRKGTLYAGPSAYQSYKTGYFAPDIDLYKKIDERGAGWRADAEEKGGMRFKYDANNDRYIATYKTSGEEVSEEDLKKSFTAYVIKDPEIQDYYKTRISEGYFGTQEQGINKMTSDLSAAVNYGVDKFGYTKKSKETGIKADPLASIYLSNKLQNEQAVVGAIIDEGKVAAPAYGDPNAVNQLNAGINQAETDINKSAQESIARQLVEQLGTYNTKTRRYEDKNGDPITFTEEQNKQVQEKNAEFASALEGANRTGNYDKVIELAKDMNPAIRRKIDLLASANTPKTAQTRNNNSVLEKAVQSSNKFKSYQQKMLLTNPLLAVQYKDNPNAVSNQIAQQYISEKGLDIGTSMVKIDQEIENATPNQQNAFLKVGKQVADNYQMFTGKGTLINYTIDEKGDIIKTPQSALMSSLLDSDIFSRDQNILKQITQRIGKQGTLSMEDGGAFVLGEDEKRNVAEPIKIEGGKFIQVVPAKADYGGGISYTYDNLPGTKDGEFKYVQKIIIREVDSDGNLVKDENNNINQVEALVAQNDSEFNLQSSSGYDFNPLIRNAEKSQRRNVENQLNIAMEQFEGLKKEEASTQLATSTNPFTGEQINLYPQEARYTAYTDGKSKVEMELESGIVKYYVNGQLLETSGRSNQAIKTALMTKIEENRNNTGLK